MSKYSNIQITFESNKVFIRNKFTYKTRLEYNINDSVIEVVSFDDFGMEILN